MIVLRLIELGLILLGIAGIFILLSWPIFGRQIYTDWRAGRREKRRHQERMEELSMLALRADQDRAEIKQLYDEVGNEIKQDAKEAE